MIVRLNLSVLTGLLFIGLAVAAAGDRETLKNSTPEQRAELQTEWMKSALSLDQNQVPLVHEINLKYARKNQAAMDSGGSKLKMYRKLKDLSAEKEKALATVLTKEQYRTYEEKKDELKEKVKDRASEKRRR